MAETKTKAAASIGRGGNESRRGYFTRRDHACHLGLLTRLDLLEQKDGKWRVQVELTRRWFARQAKLTGNFA